MRDWSRSDWLVLLALMLVASFFRFWRLNEIPVGFQFDEAYNASDALRVLAGERPLFFEANGGREALYVYWIAPFIAVVGTSAFALHLASAVIGVGTVALSYVLWRRTLPPADRALAACASLLLAISYWHIHFSRYGIRAISLPLMLTLIFYALWAATQPAERREWVIARAAKNWRAVAPAPLLAWVVCGALLGLAQYAHPAARLIPFIITAWVIWYVWNTTETASSPLAHFAVWRDHTSLRGLLLIALTSFIVFLPLGLYFLNHPEQFVGHPQAVVSLDLVSNLARVAGMFFVRGDEAWIHNLAGRPVFDAGLAVFFVIGLLDWFWRLRAREAPAVFLLIWLTVMLLPTLLSDAAPNFSRAIGALPALFLIPAWGLRQAYYLARNLLRRAPLRQAQRSSSLPFAAHRLLVPIGGVLITASAFAAYDDYFNVFPNRPEVYTAYDVNKVDTAKRLDPLAQANRIYMPPLLAQHATVDLLTRSKGYKSFDNGEIVVLPAHDGRGMVYAFPADADAEYLSWFEYTYGTLARKQVTADAQNKPLLIEYHIAPHDIPAGADKIPASLPIAPHKIVNANFNDEIRFVGYRIMPSPDREKPYQLTLVWQARKPAASDYTLFIHLNTADGKRVSQRDRRAGNGSYPTNGWSAGDIVAEIYEVFPKGAQGALQFSVGWYRRSDDARLPVLDPNGKAIDDKVTFAAEGTR